MNARIALSLLPIALGLACSLQSFDDVTGGALSMGGSAGTDAAPSTGGAAGSAGSAGSAAGAALDAGTEASAGGSGVTVTGSLDFVDRSPSPTSVILAPASSFDPDVLHSAVPEGPKVSGVTTSWSIENVPPGNYLVLVAFEDDGLTRDPKFSETPISVGNDSVQVGSIPVSPAIVIVKPHGETLPATQISFEWIDDEGEMSYDVSLIDSAGNQVWAAGYFAGTTQIGYEGPVLAPGQYQLRVRSVGSDLLPIHRSEDLAGTFTVP
jgi:hypothetical protein